MFNGVAQHCARHVLMARMQEGDKGLFVSFAYFAQKPTDCFVNQIVRMKEKFVCYCQAIAKVITTDKMHT